MNLRLRTINVGTLIGRTAKVVETLARRKVDVAALHEVRYSTEETKLVRAGKFESKLFWLLKETGRGAVGIMVKKN